jgi:hypothetical protein
MNELPELPHDINPPDPWLPGVFIPWWGWALAALVVTILLVLLILLARRKAPDTPPDLPSLYAKYRRHLEALAGDLAGKPLARVATEASLAIRGFLSSALSEPALFETHEETLARSDALHALPQGAREHLIPLLNRLAEYKYGPSRTDETLARDLVEDCLKVLGGLDSTRHRTIA